MKKLFLLVGLIFVFGTFTNAQNLAIKRANLTPVVTKSIKATVAKDNNVPVFVPGPNFKRCGTADADAYRMANDPDYRAGRLAFEQKVQTWLAEHPNYDPKGSVITIPVVVHVIYNTSTAAEKLTITQVNEQIAYTNADYAGLNPHSMDAFPSTLRANCGIQFCLATVDPSGNSTTGIDYKQTTVTSFSITGSAASCSGYPERCTSTGGAAAWDVTKYLNIWTCNAGGSLCGISEFPTSPNNVYYGTTINYMYFGHTGASSPYNLGGTYSHESGHCLNLYHTWGDDGGPCTGTDNCNDTPNSGNMNYGNIEGGSLAESSTGVSHINTSTNVETDNCTTTSPGVLFQDFMDYTDDIDYACFTPNQSARMTATLAAADLGLTTSATTKCGAQAQPAAAFTANNTSVNVGATVTFTDQTTNLPTTWSWALTPSTGFSYATGYTAASQNPQITFTTAGTYTVALTATNAKGSNTCTKPSYITVTTPTAPPVAAFTYTPTTGPITTTVSFTDASTNTPTTWLWTLQPATGFTWASGTSASQNPKINFTTAGTYTVTLKATNSVGNNSVSHNVVITTPTAGCDTLMPLSMTTGSCIDSLTLYVPDAVSPMDTGYISGQNGKYHWAELTMKYTIPAGLVNATISDVCVLYALKAGTTGSTTCKIYTNNAGSPSATVLGTSAAITKANIDTTNFGINFKNKYHFATAIPVTSGTTYFVSITIPSTWAHNTDELAIWEENIACSAVDSAAYLKYNSTWYSFVSAFGSNIDMAILPIVCTSVGTNTNDIAPMQDNVVLYPNPANDQFTIGFLGNQQNNVTVSVYNSVGALVKNVQVNNFTDHINLDMKDVSKGIYLVNIKTPEGTIIKKVSLIK